jgi:hypothetical protein
MYSHIGSLAAASDGGNEPARRPWNYCRLSLHHKLPLNPINSGSCMKRHGSGRQQLYWKEMYW